MSRIKGGEKQKWNDISQEYNQKPKVSKRSGSQKSPGLFFKLDHKVRKKMEKKSQEKISKLPLTQIFKNSLAKEKYL